MNFSGQGAIEYLLIIAAAILVVAIVIIAMTGALAGGQDQGAQSIDKQCSSFQGLQYAQNKEEYASIQSGLLGYWNLNGNTNDISGNNQHGFDCGLHCPTAVEGLWNSNAYEFDGADDYLAFGDFYPAEEIRTISFWANFDSKEYVNGQEIVSKSSNGRGVEVLWFNAGLSYYVMTDGSDNSEITKPESEIELGEWYFVVATQTAGGNTEFYVNNIPVGSGIAPATIDDPAGNKDLLFGNWNQGIRWYDGTLEEVGIWNKVISPAERDFLWNNGKGREIIFCE